LSVFDLLAPELRRVLAETGIGEPTEPQELAIPPILAGENMLLIAPTGMGKTEAAVIPVFDRMITERPKAPSFLYITPLRALNRDMLRRLKDWAGKLGISVGVRHGDTPQHERAEQVRHPPDMLITTPETLQIMFGGSMLKELLKTIRWVVVDEVHELAGDERGWQLSVGLERLARFAGRDFQRIGLSATVGNAEEVGAFLAGAGRHIKVLRVPVGKSLKISVEAPVPKDEDTPEAEGLRCDTRTLAAIRRCKALIEGRRSTLLFVNTRDNAEVLASRFHLWKPDFPIGVHHGSLYRDIRIQMEDDFKSEKLRGLICTSSLELGIDVGSVELSIQYGSPRQATRLVQRVGRSGHRRGLVSEGVIMALDADDASEAAVLSRKAVAEEIEPVEMRQNPLGVLANQLVASTVGRREADLTEVYETVRKAHPFRELDRATFDAVLQQLVSLRILWKEEGRFSRRRGAIQFFYDNLSMIPDEKSYRIIDITTRRSIGTLDEFFIATYGEVGVRFIVKGASWRIVELGEDSVLVEPSPELGAIPGWIGEEIPVPFEAAQEVGRLRALLSGAVSPARMGEAGPEGRPDYPLDADAMRLITDQLDAQKKGGFALPTDKRVVVEPHQNGRILVLNACFGTKVNDTLARLLSAFLSARLASEIGIQTDPYRIIFELPAPVKPETVVEQLKKLEPDDVAKVLRLVIANSSILKRELLHTSRKFGAVDKRADFRNVSFDRIARLYKDTPLYDEAVEKTLFDRMDIPRTADVLRRIREGLIEVAVGPPSPIGSAGIQLRWDMLATGKVERPILLAFKARLEKSQVRLFCLACKKTARRQIKELPERIVCPYCKGKMVAAVPLWDEKSIEVAARKTVAGAEEKKTVLRLKKNANLVLAHGKRAVLALAARGVGEGTAARLLNFQHETEEEFLRAVLAAEVQYAKNRRFW
jgi:ATP-dependent Lhr-like helicase